MSQKLELVGLTREELELMVEKDLNNLISEIDGLKNMKTNGNTLKEIRGSVLEIKETFHMFLLTENGVKNEEKSESWDM